MSRSLPHTANCADTALQQIDAISQVNAWLVTLSLTRILHYIPYTMCITLYELLSTSISVRNKHAPLAFEIQYANFDNMSFYIKAYMLQETCKNHLSLLM